MKLRTSTLIWSLVAVLVFVSGGALFLANYELVEETFRTPAGKEARQNPYLAAERFLHVNHVNSKSVSASRLLDNLPPSSDTLFLANNGNDGLITEQRHEKLYDWMYDGGHLITIIRTLWDDESQSSGDPFLDSFGIRQYMHDYDDDTEDEKLEPHLETDFAGKGATLTLEFLPMYYMIDHNESAYAGIRAREGYHLLQYAIGAGTLTVLTDERLFRNDNIGDNDHALFFYNLVHNSDTPATESTVWIVHDLEFPSLMSLIWKHAPFALIAFSVLLVFMLWAAYNRFGPALLDNYRLRRSLLEHLDACGRYHWRHDQGTTLLATVREQLQHLLAQHYPGWHELGTERQLDWLGKRSRQSLNVLHQALHASPTSEHDFIDIIQNLQRLRKIL